MPENSIGLLFNKLAVCQWDAPGVFADLAQHPGKVHKGVLITEPVM